MNIIVVGCGRVGSALATMLSEQGHNVTVIDLDETAFQRLGSTFNGITIKGLGFDEDTLRLAGIEECDFFCAVTNLDNTNFMAVQVAEVIFDVPNVVARLYNPQRIDTFERLQLDYVCGTNLVAEVFAEKVNSGHDHHVDVYGEVEIVLFTIGEEWVGKPVSVMAEEGSILPAIIKRGSHTFIPTLKTIFESGDIIRAAVHVTETKKLRKYMDKV